MTETAKSNVVIIGYRGVGKTTVGALLAERLSARFVDLDDEIEREQDATVSEIFAAAGELTRGEEEFRRIEKDVLARFLADAGTMGRVVLATGGGAVLDAESARRLAGFGRLVFLFADVKTLCARLAEGYTERPRLTALREKDEVTRKFEERTAAYRELAAIEADTRGLTPVEVAERVEAALVPGGRPVTMATS